MKSSTKVALRGVLEARDKWMQAVGVPVSGTRLIRYDETTGCWVEWVRDSRREVCFRDATVDEAKVWRIFLDCLTALSGGKVSNQNKPDA